MGTVCAGIGRIYVRLLISKAATIDSRRTSFSLSPTAAAFLMEAWRMARGAAATCIGRFPFAIPILAIAGKPLCEDWLPTAVVSMRSSPSRD